MAPGRDSYPGKHCPPWQGPLVIPSPRAATQCCCGARLGKPQWIHGELTPPFPDPATDSPWPNRLHPTTTWKTRNWNSKPSIRRSSSTDGDCAEQQIRDTEARAARQEIYEQPDEIESLALPNLREFRFTTRHLLIATAVLAVVMTMIKLIGECNSVFFTGLAALGAGWWWVLRQERQAAAERMRQLEENAARTERNRASAAGQPVAPAPRPAAPAAEAAPPPHKPALRFSFSIQQILGVMAVASVVLTLATLLGPDQAALFLGAIAVVGLVIQVLGIELPGIVVFGWWVLLVLYVLMSVWALFFSRGGPG